MHTDIFKILSKMEAHLVMFYFLTTIRMYKMRKFLLMISLIPSFCFAGNTGGWLQIKNIYVWGNGAANHFMVNLHNQSANLNATCPGGYWYGTTAGERDHIWETVNGAYQSKTKVKIHFDESQDWPSMSVKDCKIVMIELEDTAL